MGLLFGQNQMPPPDFVYVPVSLEVTINQENVNMVPSLGSSEADLYTIAPALPGGITIDEETGVISGVGNVLSPLTYYDVTASNTFGNTTAEIDLTVKNLDPPAGLVYSPYYTSLTVDLDFMDILPTLSSGVADYYSILPILPLGLILDSLDGRIYGTPSESRTNTIYTVTAGNSAGSTTRNLEIEVIGGAPSGLTYNPDYLSGFSGLDYFYSTPNIVSGTVDNYSMSPTTPLPIGLSLNATSGIIEGIPLLPAPFQTYTIEASNPFGFTQGFIDIEIF